MNYSNLTYPFAPVDQYFDLHVQHYYTLINIYCYYLPPVCIAGIALNLIAAYHLQGRSWRNSAIRVYLLSLTVLDSLQLLFTLHVSVPHMCMLQEQSSSSPFVTGLCDTYRDYVFRVFECASATVDTAHMWSMVVLTAHRYWKISKPLHAHIHDRPQFAKTVLITVNVLALVFRAPMFFEYELTMTNGTDARVVLTPTILRRVSSYNMWYWLIANTVLYNIAPFLTLTTLNALILATLHKARFAVRKDYAYRNREVRAAIAICLVVSLFLAFHSLSIYDVIQQWRVWMLHGELSTNHPIVSAVSVLLAAISSALNPVIYVALGSGFRLCHRTIAHWHIAKGGSDQSRNLAMKAISNSSRRRAMTAGALSLCELVAGETETLVPHVRSVRHVNSLAVVTEASALLVANDDHLPRPWPGRKLIWAPVSAGRADSAASLRPEIESNFGLTKSLLVGDAACFFCPVDHSSQPLAADREAAAAIAADRVMLLLVANVALLVIAVPTVAYPTKIPIRAFVLPEEVDGGTLNALVFSEHRHNKDQRNPFKLALRDRKLKIDPSNTWGLLSTICDELKTGFMVMLSGGDARSHDAYISVAETLEIPYVNWQMPPILPVDGATNDFEVTIRPPTAEILADLIVHKGWIDIVYMHDGRSAAQNVQWMYHHIHKQTNRSIYTEMVRLPRDAKDFPEFLKKFHVTRYYNETIRPTRVILDTSSQYRQEKILAALRTAPINQRHYHYVVANYDFSPFDIDEFQNGLINITGFQILNRQERHFWSFKKQYDNFTKPQEQKGLTELDISVAFVHDAVLVATKALEVALATNDSLFHQNFRHGQLYNRGFRGIYCHPSEDMESPERPFTTFEHGKRIAKALRNTRLTTEDGTLTGTIQFDKFGFRKNFEVTVIDLVSSEKSAFNQKEVLSWKQGHGLSQNATQAQHTRKELDKNIRKKVRVVTVTVEPFVMVKRVCEQKPESDPNTPIECRGNNRFEGYCIDLLKLLQERIADFEHEIFLSAGNKYGAKKSDGSWDGMIGYLLNGGADVAVAPLTINQDRERVVDFSKPFMTTGISIMIKKPDKQEFSVFSFMQPLSTEIWMYIIFAYVGVSVVIFLVSRFSPYEWRVEEMANGGFTISNDFSVYNCLWFTLAAFMQQGTDILPRSISGRIASSAWWFFTMIIVSSYTANLAAFLTLEKMQAPIESVEDLAKQTKIKYGIQQGGSTAEFFKHSSVQIYQRMWRYMESQVPSVFTSTYAEGIERVRTHKGRYAFLLEATANDYANTRKPCDTMRVGSNLNSVGYGVATAFGSPYKNFINLAILALQETGELKKLENKWWYDRGQCEQGISDGQSASLNLSKVAGIFYILMGGMIASMVAALGEFLYRSRIEARKGKVTSLVGNFAKTLRSALYAQLRLSMQGGAVANEGTEAYEIIKEHKVGHYSISWTQLQPVVCSVPLEKLVASRCVASVVLKVAL
uniref:Glutamate receptor 1 n=1 Tax=Plectus sambesii TaxID=2011161 RepID=A0A914UT28_9BILA